MISLLTSLLLSTSNFPTAIQTASKAKTLPACTLCHAGVTSRGTVTTPFGQSMMTQGMKASDETALKSAFDKLKAAKTDSDKDGVPDADELAAGKDPNVADAAGAPAPQPSYGCAQAPWGGLLPWCFIAFYTAILRRRPAR